MAGRPKKIVDENTTIEKNKTENSTVNKTKSKSVDNSVKMDKLQKENDELKAQIQMMLDKISSIEEKQVVNTNVAVEETTDNYKEISPLKPIKVISLSDGGVSLRTSANGSGKTFRFDKFGHSISITYSDLQDVIATDRTFIEEGTVYICDEDVVKNNYLDEYYNKFLSADKITNILSFSKSDIVDMVSNTTESIQETIISIIVKKINNNEYVDMNKVDAIGKSCKNPCDIPTLALQKRIQ